MNDDRRNMLILSNMGLVYGTAKRLYRTGQGYEWDDLISKGTIGLIYAIDHFKPDKGFTLSTYAGRCVKGEMMKLIQRESDVIRVPHNSKKPAIPIVTLYETAVIQQPSDLPFDLEEFMEVVPDQLKRGVRWWVLNYLGIEDYQQIAEREGRRAVNVRTWAKRCWNCARNTSKIRQFFGSD